MPARSRLWPDPRVQPPYRAAEIDWAHPLAANLSFLALYNERGGQPHDLVGTTPMTRGATVAYGQNARGPAATFTGAATSQIPLRAGTFYFPASSVGGTLFSVGAVATTGDLRMMVCSTGSTSRFGLAMGRTANKVSGFFRTAAALLELVTVSTIAVGDLFSASVTVQAADARLYLNGAPEASNTATVSLAATLQSLDSTAAYIGAIGGGGSLNWNGTLNYSAIWQRVMTDAEERWLHAEPYAMLRPIVRRRYFVPATGPTTDYVLIALPARAVAV